MDDPPNSPRESGEPGIDPQSLLDDPLEQFRNWFADAQCAEIYEPTAMVLSTVNEDGQPSSRVVLLKDVNAQGFVFFTDYSSRKGREIESSRTVSLLFWWDRLHRQVRIEGSVAKVDAETSDRYFDIRPLGSRLSAIVSHQSQVVESRALLEERVSELERSLQGSPPQRPDRWGGYCVTPVSMEFWQGRTNRLHDRVHYHKQDSGWRKERLSP